MIYLKITDDITTLDLTWNQQASTSYLLRSWPTAIAALNPNELGFAYAAVEEDITIDILGDSVSAVNGALLALTQLLDQADRWWRGDFVDPVYLDYWPDEGASIWRTMVLGRARRNETSGVSVAATYQKDAQMWAIQNIRVRLRREGIWRTKEVIESAVPLAVANPFVGNYFFSTNTFAMQDAPPTQYVLTGVTTTSQGEFVIASNQDHQKSIIALCARPNVGPAIILRDGEDMVSFTTTGATVAVVADGSNLAKGGDVFRITSTSPGSSVTELVYDFPNTATWKQARRVQFFITVRSNTTNVQWNMNILASIRWGAFTTDLFQGERIVIPGTTQQPQLIQSPIGILPSGATQFTLKIEDAATSGSPTLDIDTIMVVDLTYPDSTVIVLDSLNSDNNTGWPFGATSFQVYIDPIDKQQRYVYGKLGSGEEPNVDYRGNALTFLRTKDVTVGFIGCYEQYWSLPTTPTSGVNQTFNIHLFVYGGKVIPQSAIPPLIPDAPG